MIRSIWQFKHLAFSTFLFFSLHANSQTWPNSPIKLIVPYPPAGATDVVARLIADSISHANHWTIVIDNKPGAGGNIGMDLLAKSKPDGYTLAVGQTSNLAINTTLYRKIPYDYQTDITPIAFITQQALVLVVKSDSPINSFKEFIEFGKLSKKPLLMASAGTGTVGHLAGIMLSKKVDIPVAHIPYKGASAAITDLIGGQTDFMLPTPQSVLPLIKAGKVKPLAVTSLKRIAVLPNVPTISESGYLGFEAVDWKVLVGPSKMPIHMVTRLHQEVEQIVSNSEVQNKIQAEGSEAMQGSPEKLRQFIQSENLRWGEVIKAANITVD